jgi:hypothetical protein
VRKEGSGLKSIEPPGSTGAAARTEESEATGTAGGGSEEGVGEAEEGNRKQTREKNRREQRNKEWRKESGQENGRDITVMTKIRLLVVTETGMN